MKYIQLEIPFDYEEEIFKDIEEYQGEYQVSNLGRIYSVKRNKFKKPKKNNKDDYLRISLYKDGKLKTFLIHRLVATAFIPNPQRLPVINHKDENPSNNHVSNLEWCTQKYNANYGTGIERRTANPNWRILNAKARTAAVAKLSKSVLQFTLNGEFVKEYPSIMEASRQTKIDQSSISRCCRGVKYCNSAGGYVWRYKEKEEVA